MTTHRFKTYREASDAGYRRASPHTHKDGSGGKWVSYDFEDSNGNRTVNVYLTEEKNRMGTKGCFVPMFPPTTS